MKDGRRFPVRICQSGKAWAENERLWGLSGNILLSLQDPRKSYGLLSRFTLNYDFVFLALLRLSSAEDAEMHFKKCRCTFNPAVKCNRLCTCDNSLEYSADVAMLLLYGKVCDNIKDESFFKRLGYRLLLPFAKSKRKKAAKKHPVLSERIDRSSLWAGKGRRQRKIQPRCLLPSFGGGSCRNNILRHWKRCRKTDIWAHRILYRQVGLSCRCSRRSWKRQDKKRL